MPYRNIPIHPVLRLIYFFFRLLAWAGMGVFFRRRIVLGDANFRFDGPAIVVTNHPSTLMDVFNSGLLVRQEMFFLANYGMFKHPVTNWLFTRLFCIPVKRREDVTEGEERSNRAAFEQSFQHLEKNGVLFIAAEGTSWMNRWVREFKTGAARIAFGAESRNDWALEVKIIPVGLSYSAPDKFRSNVVVHCGEAVWPRDWKEVWQQNPSEAVADFTAELRRRVAALTIHARDEQGEKFIARLEEILENEAPSSFKENFFKIKKIADTQLDNEVFKLKTDLYFGGLQSARLSDLGLKSWSAPNASWRTFSGVFLLVAGFAPFAIGYLFWLLPCWLPWFLNKKLNFYVGYSSTVKMLAGFITFPLALWAAHRFLPDLLDWPNAGWLFVLPAVALGFFAEHYMNFARRAWERFKAGRFSKAEPKKSEALTALRREILSLLK